MRPREKLLRRADYLRCYRTGRRRSGALVFLYFVPNLLGHARLGITATRKVGNAVVRHRLKRRIKEIYRRWPGRIGALSDPASPVPSPAGGASIPSLGQARSSASSASSGTNRPVLGAFDVVVHLKPEAKSSGFADLARDLVNQLEGVAERRDGGARRRGA